MSHLFLIPKPKKQMELSGTFFVPGKLGVIFPPDLSGLAMPLKTVWPELLVDQCQDHIHFNYDESLGAEAYRLEISLEGISVSYHFPAGVFYSLMTLRQITAAAGKMPEAAGVALPCVLIEDSPGLKTRGMLIDISRGKVPALDTLKKSVDLLASFKYNHLELYIEGFSFAYPSFPDVWKEDASLLPEEIRELDAYCKARFIELVPHQNSFGHMAHWLARPEFSHLAESEDGLIVRGMRFPSTTLDVSDPGSLKLMQKLMEDLLPAFTSESFHVGLDEAFEFGQGKNRACVEQGDAVRILADYICGLRNLLKAQGRRMIMWDDLLVKYPGLIQYIPEDIQIFDWGYDAEFPVEKRARFLQDHGLDYCVCPGTSSWSSFTGLTDNMLENVRRAGEAAYKFGASGMILTDWGDMNHLQYWPVSYAGIVYSAAFAWNRSGASEEELADTLDAFVFCDREKMMGRFCLKAGRFYLQEEFRLPCRSLACLPLLYGEISREVYDQKEKALAEIVTYFSPEEVCQAYLESYRCRKDFDGERLYAFLEECRQMLRQAQPSCTDGKMIADEYANALDTLFLLTRIRESIITGKAAEISGLLNKVIVNHRRLWMARNKQSSLESGVQMFKKFEKSS